MGIAQREINKRARAQAHAQLNPADRHQLRIAKETLAFLSDAADGLLGGPTKAEARLILSGKFGWTEAQIANLESAESRR